MLTERQIEEVRENLDKAQNPVFFYDNDVDGLCSYLILRRYLGRGKGVAVKSYPDLGVQYAAKVKEWNADYVFILDKPLISLDFIQEIDKMQVPIIWIDHHDIEGQKPIPTEVNISIYNPSKNSGKNKSSEPVTYISYKIAHRKEDVWLAIMGCIADHYIPSFAKEFAKNFPDFWGKVKTPFDAYYKTEIGKLAQALSFGIKDSISHVVALQNFIIGCKGPQDVMAELEGNKPLRARYAEIRKKYDVLLEEAEKDKEGSLIFFEYSGDLSISSDLSNELAYKNPGKYIAVAFKKGIKSNVSLRGKNIKKLLEELLPSFKDSSGGGHPDAVGARIGTADLQRFKEALKEKIK